MPRLCSHSSRPYPWRSARNAVDPAMGAGLRPRPKDLDWPPDPKAGRTAPLGAIPVVIGQKSAEAIVAQHPGQCPGHGEGPNTEQGRSLHELA
jgi:hypothetical protein